jgi:hypothetical protein
VKARWLTVEMPRVQIPSRFIKRPASATWALQPRRTTHCPTSRSSLTSRSRNSSSDERRAASIRRGRRWADAPTQNAPRSSAPQRAQGTSRARAHCEATNNATAPFPRRGISCARCSEPQRSPCVRDPTRTLRPAQHDCRNDFGSSPNRRIQRCTCIRAFPNSRATAATFPRWRVSEATRPS